MSLYFPVHFPKYCTCGTHDGRNWVLPLCPPFRATQLIGERLIYCLKCYSPCSLCRPAQLPNLQVRLSERMVVDVVAKLKSLGLFPDDLLHTTNGREYITTSQVKKEIKMALEQCGGRVALVDLPGLLNIDYSHSSAQADEVVKVRNAIP